MATIKVILAPEQSPLAAGFEFVRRTHRESHPDGTFDANRVWHPSRREQLPCCKTVPRATLSNPYVQNWHCRTALHVAGLYDVREWDVELWGSLIERFGYQDIYDKYEVIRNGIAMYERSTEKFMTRRQVSDLVAAILNLPREQSLF